MNHNYCKKREMHLESATVHLFAADEGRPGRRARDREGPAAASHALAHPATARLRERGVVVRVRRP